MPNAVVVTLAPKAQKIAADLVNCLVLEGLTPARAAAIAKTYAEQLAGKRVKVAPAADTRALADRVKPMMLQYQALYRAAFHEDPQVTGRDYGTLDKLLRTYGAESVTRRLNTLATARAADPFLAGMGFTIGVLAAQWNKLAALEQTAASRTGAVAATASCRHRPPCPTQIACTQRTLAAARQSSSNGTTWSPPTTSTRNGASSEPR